MNGGTEDSDLATKVLLIDDDGDILEILGELLRHEGFEVHACDGVEPGLALMETMRPDAVILDLVYQGSGTIGLDAARTIKLRHPALPLIVLSAVAREYALGFGRDELAADAYVVKPPRISSLVELIRRKTGSG